MWIDNCPALDDVDKDKKRPLIVVDPLANPLRLGLDPTEKVAIVVACSATYGTDEPDGILMPNRSTEPQTLTGLSKICWAIPRWQLPVRHSTINDVDMCEYSGTLGNRKLQELLVAYLARRTAVPVSALPSIV